MVQRLRDGRYLSHEITDEFIGMMASKVCSDILSEVCQAEWFGIIGDEALQCHCTGLIQNTQYCI